MIKIGDRTLVCFVADNYLQFPFYDFKFYNSYNQNLIEIPFYDDSEIENWFFVY